MLLRFLRQIKICTDIFINFISSLFRFLSYTDRNQNISIFKQKLIMAFVQNKIWKSHDVDYAGYFPHTYLIRHIN